MSRHTPEPWEVEVNDLRGGRYYTVRRPGREDIDIHEEDGGAEDAPVIAAAPDLLGALRNCQALLQTDIRYRADQVEALSLIHI